MTEVPALLQVRHLSVTYALQRTFFSSRRWLAAVSDVSFDLFRGQILGVVGESGCGKSSLARAIVGLNDAAGAVLYQQREISRMSAPELRRTRREIQYLFQDPLAALSPRRTIWQTLLEPLQLYRIGDRKNHRSRIDSVLALVDLHPDMLSRYPHELSGGQRQRVALARALVAEPTLIIADEPMSSLDVSVQARMITLLRKVQLETGVAFLFISHDLAVVRQLADEVAVMYMGQFVEAGPASRVFTGAAHPYTRALIDAAPRLNYQHRTGPATLRGEPPPALTPPAGCVFHTRCPQVMDSCYTMRPAKITLAEAPSGKHTVRCHLWNT